MVQTLSIGMQLFKGSYFSVGAQAAQTHVTREECNVIYIP